MNGVVVISGDACLYTETYIYHVVDTKLSEPARTLVRLPMPVFNASYSLVCTHSGCACAFQFLQLAFHHDSCTWLVAVRY